MSAWEIISEEANIVLVGNINPSIFHPEWFIRKGVVEEWDYTQDKVINLPDLSQVKLPGNRELSVLLNKFTLRSSLASDHLALKDFVTSTFTILSETPISQMGMNYTAVIKIHGKENWAQFGSELAPKKYWEEAADYIAGLDTAAQEMVGLWEMMMNLPRPDDLKGYVRPKIEVVQPLTGQTLSFSVNNHVEVEEHSAKKMVENLESGWDHALDLAKNLISKIMESQLGGAK